MPWTAPAYADLQLAPEPPRIFCVLSGPGYQVDDVYRENSSCTCLTEQGTRYALEMQACATIARHGQYEPYYDEQRADRNRAFSHQQLAELHSSEQQRRLGDMSGSAGTAPQPDLDPTFGVITRATP
jgi:hypothetical protein